MLLLARLIGVVGRQLVGAVLLGCNAFLSCRCHGDEEGDEWAAGMLHRQHACADLLNCNILGRGLVSCSISLHDTGRLPRTAQADSIHPNPALFTKLNLQSARHTRCRGTRGCCAAPSRQDL